MYIDYCTSHINMFGILLLKIEAGNDNVNEAV